jgi:tetrahydromethanopterin S-methyltransferase subunit D
VSEGSSGGPAAPVQGGPRNRTGGLPPGQPTANGHTDLGGVLDSVAEAAVNQAAIIVRPAAAAAVASSFAFPLILMLAVIFFLVVQPRMDGHDPKLRNAPRTASETLVQFEDEGAP